MEHSKWAAARSVVAGRLVNCYAWNDWLLALLYRSKSYEIGVAGLYPIVLPSATMATGSPAPSHTLGATSSGACSSVAAPASSASSAEEGAVITATEHFTTALERLAAADSAADSACASLLAPPVPLAPRKLEVKRYHSPLEVENCDVSHLISSHSDYPNVLPAIIRMLLL